MISTSTDISLIKGITEVYDTTGATNTLIEKHEVLYQVNFFIFTTFVIFFLIVYYLIYRLVVDKPFYKR